MCEENRTVLCGANAYEQKYFLNPEFERLPARIKDELKILCVLFTEEIGGVFLLVFQEDGTLRLEVEAAEEDILFDEIGCELKIKQIRQEKRDLLEALEMYYRTLGEI